MKTIVKIKPVQENDSYNFQLVDFSSKIYNHIRLHLSTNDSSYLNDKSILFHLEQTEGPIVNRFLECHKDRNSLKSYYANNIEKLDASIYTAAALKKNHLDSLDVLYCKIKEMLDLKSRRIVLRFLDTLTGYHSSTYISRDVSCLAFIQYFENRVSIVFRASDIKDELLVDILTIYSYFIQPIYQQSVTLDLYCTCAQNISNFNSLIQKLESA